MTCCERFSDPIILWRRAIYAYPRLGTTFDTDVPKLQGYVLLIPALSGLSDTHTRMSKIRLTVSQYSVAGSEPHTVLVAETDTLGEAWSEPMPSRGRRGTCSDGREAIAAKNERARNRIAQSSHQSIGRSTNTFYESTFLLDRSGVSRRVRNHGLPLLPAQWHSLDSPVGHDHSAVESPASLHRCHPCPPPARMSSLMRCMGSLMR